MGGQRASAKKASVWDRLGLQSGGSGILRLQTARQMPPHEHGENAVPDSPQEEPPVGALPAPLEQQPAPLGRTSHARVCCCALEAPVVHQFSPASKRIGFFSAVASEEGMEGRDRARRV